MEVWTGGFPELVENNPWFREPNHERLFVASLTRSRRRDARSARASCVGR